MGYSRGFNWSSTYFSEQETYSDALIRLYNEYINRNHTSKGILYSIAADLSMSRMAVNQRIKRLKVAGKLHRFSDGFVPPKPILTPDKKFGVEDYDKKVLDYIIQGNKLLNKKDVRQEEVCPEVNTDGWVGLVVGGDWHFEHYRTNTEEIVKDLTAIGKEPNLYFGFNGDMGDFIDLRFMELENETINFPLRDRIKVIEYLVSLTPNMLFMVMGCHDNWVRTRARRDMIEDLQSKILGYYLGFGGTVNFKVGNIVYRIAAHHKYGFEAGTNHFNPCYTYLNKMDATPDVLCFAHRHDIVGISYVYWQGQPRVFMRSGSHQYKTEYAWKEGFKGAVARYPMVILSSQQKIMLPVVDFKTGLPILRALNSDPKLSEGILSYGNRPTDGFQIQKF